MATGCQAGQVRRGTFRQRTTARSRMGRVNVRAADSGLGVLRVAQNDRRYETSGGWAMRPRLWWCRGLIADGRHIQRQGASICDRASTGRTRESDLRFAARSEGCGNVGRDSLVRPVLARPSDLAAVSVRGCRQNDRSMTVRRCFVPWSRSSSTSLIAPAFKATRRVITREMSIAPSLPRSSSSTNSSRV